MTINAKQPRGLTQLQRAFCQQYMITGNATEAYIRAGYACGKRETAACEGSKLLRKPKIAAHIAELSQKAEDAAVEDTAKILNMWHAAAMVDPREISEVRRGACRYCHGQDHAYQWRTADELEDKLREYENKTKRSRKALRKPTNESGFGYRRSNIPHPSCPICDGEGFAYAYFHDSRGYSQEAAVAYDGVAQTQHGIKVHTIGRLEAAKYLATHYKMLNGDTGEVVKDAMQVLIESIQQRGSKAPLNGHGDAPVAKPDKTSRI
ncbi:terminase small subunit [uncultured Sulfitobacter sp.]|uniref:terminase small subunit n=1 Tax=uncultured Sulfitobacter sp. TaxID=191468 RepID=UPI0026050D5F|nr:terminase small subunit [uncultured Sulfitobacter sp.]